jgi:uncharacterized membrane protein
MRQAMLSYESVSTNLYATVKQHTTHSISQIMEIILHQPPVFVVIYHHVQHFNECFFSKNGSSVFPWYKAHLVQDRPKCGDES